MKSNIKLENQKCFKKPYIIPQEKIDNAIKNTLNKLEKCIPKWTENFDKTCSVDFK